MCSPGWLFTAGTCRRILNLSGAAVQPEQQCSTLALEIKAHEVDGLKIYCPCTGSSVNAMAAHAYVVLKNHALRQEDMHAL